MVAGSSHWTPNKNQATEILSRRTKNRILVGDAESVRQLSWKSWLRLFIVVMCQRPSEQGVYFCWYLWLGSWYQYRGSFEENIQNLVNEVKEIEYPLLWRNPSNIRRGSTGEIAVLRAWRIFLSQRFLVVSWPLSGLPLRTDHCFTS